MYLLQSQKRTGHFLKVIYSISDLIYIPEDSYSHILFTYQGGLDWQARDTEQKLGEIMAALGRILPW